MSMTKDIENHCENCLDPEIHPDILSIRISGPSFMQR